MQEAKIAHCPHCAKPILNGGQFQGFAKFNIKCPWCQNSVVIEIMTKIVVAPVEQSKVLGDTEKILIDIN